MKKIICGTLIAAAMFGSVSCEEWLDVNTNPNGPDQVVDPHLYLAPMLSELAIALQNDGRYIGKYTSNFFSAAQDVTWDRHGYASASDAAATLWRSTYYTMGLNLRDMILKAEEQQKWEFVGIGHALQAYNWQMTTDQHGEIIMSEAFDPTKSSFNYDKQEVIYAEVKRLAELAIADFAKAKANPHPNPMSKDADLIYAGDISKWEKFAYGLLAINANHLSNKSNYEPDKVVEYVDKALASNADDAAIKFLGTNTANSSFFGPSRGNIGSAGINLRQSKFIVGLLDGTNPALRDVEYEKVTVPNSNPPRDTVRVKLVANLPVPKTKDPVAAFNTQHLKDPRIAAMLAPAGDGQYRGIGFSGTGEYTTTTQRPLNLWGTASDVTSATTVGKYLFQNNASFPIMTYAQLQFIKAEALYRSNKKAEALVAYKNGVEKHMDFTRTFLTTAEERTAFDSRKAAYMTNPWLIPTNTEPSTTPEGFPIPYLTLSHIMLQKYIAQWGWGFLETWSDLRRYHYFDKYDEASRTNVPGNPVTVGSDLNLNDNVFTAFQINPTMFGVNGGMPAYRIRPRYNSEYLWNAEALRQIGGFDAAFHTYETWFSKKN